MHLLNVQKHTTKLNGRSIEVIEVRHKTDNLVLSLAETSNARRGQHYWSTIGSHLLSRTVLLHHIKPNLVCQVLDFRLIDVN